MIIDDLSVIQSKDDHLPRGFPIGLAKMKPKVEQFCSDAAGDDSWQLGGCQVVTIINLFNNHSLCVITFCTEELVASELLKQDFINLNVRSKDSAHASRRTVKISCWFADDHLVKLSNQALCLHPLCL